MAAHAETAPATRPALPTLTRVELRKMGDTRAGFWLLLTIGLVTAGIVVILLLTGGEDDLASLYGNALLPLSVLLPVIGILAMTGEWSQRTALSTFTLVPERTRVIAAKLAAGSVLAALSIVVCVVAAAIGNLFAGGDWGLGASDLATGFLYQWLGVLMGLAFGLLLMNSALAIVMYFVLPTAWSLLGELISWLGSAAAWLDTGRTFTPLVENEMAGTDWAKLAATVALWVLVPLVAGLVRVTRREMT
jgi:ABC-2 type transport system permease protein